MNKGRASTPLPKICVALIFVLAAYAVEQAAAVTCENFRLRTLTHDGERWRDPRASRESTAGTKKRDQPPLEPLPRRRESLDRTRTHQKADSRVRAPPKTRIAFRSQQIGRAS